MRQHVQLQQGVSRRQAASFRSLPSRQSSATLTLPRSSNSSSSSRKGCWLSPLLSQSSSPACQLHRTSSQVGVEISPVSCSDTSNDTSSQHPQEQLRVQPVSGIHEVEQVAKLRAEAFYEDDRSRFVESFKKKFARGEAESLEQRTAPAPPNGAPLCECLVAVDSSNCVVGCIDVRLPSSATAKHPLGVPQGDDAGCYILNVVVDEDQRGKGVGKTLMKAAMQRAVSRWGSKRLYTHVAGTNDVALKLYVGCGFKEHSVDAQAFDPASNLGKLVLLQALAEDLRA